MSKKAQVSIWGERKTQVSNREAEQTSILEEQKDKTFREWK